MIETARRKDCGFSLVASLVVMAALLLLAVGLLTLVGLERKTARSYVDAKRAEWIARAGMEEVRSILRRETANDDFLIFAKAGAEVPGVEHLDYLYLARGGARGGKLEFAIEPLFSADRALSSVANLGEVESPESLTAGDVCGISPRPWAAAAQVAWKEVTDESGRVVGRYGYWVDDLQSRIDAGGVAEDPRLAWEDGRTEWPHPAPGVAPDSAAGPRLKLDVLGGAPGELVNLMVNGRHLLVSPDSLLAAAGIGPPLERSNAGRLVEFRADMVERMFSARVRPYLERPVVPFGDGLSPQVMGLPKKDLNKLLGLPREESVDEFARWVLRGLPGFTSRKGGFPDDYLETLAANAFDYADEDGDGTVRHGVYRGVDSYPLVSEHLMKFRWESVENDGGRYFVVMTSKVYLELWNMSNQPASGTFQVSYETDYLFPFGPAPEDERRLGREGMMEDPLITTPQLEEEDGYYWLPQQEISLAPNEYRVVECGGVTHRMEIGYAELVASQDAQAIPKFALEKDFGSGYRLKWNGRRVDQSRGNMARAIATLFYHPNDIKTKPRQRVRATVAGHSYTDNVGIGKINNPGDPRMSNYISLTQEPNDYPNNFSPNRRNVRRKEIYLATDPEPTKPKVSGRVLPSQWADGGHDTAFGPVPPGLNGGDERINPDDAAFFTDVPTPRAVDAPMRISNRGKFLSATELGRVYDPVMWTPSYGNAADTARILSGYIPDGRRRWPSVAMDSTASSKWGGGNSLRVGRQEHPRFDVPGLRGAHLLDLFFAVATEAGEAKSLVDGGGRLNLNTAGEEVIRTLAAGVLKQDPALGVEAEDGFHETTSLLAVPVEPAEFDAPTTEKAADRVARAIVGSRPFATAAELAGARDESGQAVFGNVEMYVEGERMQWSDSAAEEVFARVYNGSTVRSRNFRVWVVGQAMSGERVVAEVCRRYTVFADPGVRDGEGAIKPSEFEVRVLDENDF